MQSFETYLSVNDNLCGKLVSSVALPMISNDSLRFNFHPFFQTILFYQAANLITLHLYCYIESFYTIVIETKINLRL